MENLKHYAGDILAEIKEAEKMCIRDRGHKAPG